MSSGASDRMREACYMTHPHHEGSPPSAFAPADQLTRRHHASRSKKAAAPTKATPADSLAETPAEPTEHTRDTTTLAFLQVLALKVDALSTRLDEQDNKKNKEHRDIPSDDDEVSEGGNKEPEHDARTTAATGGTRGVTAMFIDPRDWEDLLPREYQDCPPPSRATRPSLYLAAA
eukprot:jgi/Tetstr1/458083/TSEL_044590.t1